MNFNDIPGWFMPVDQALFTWILDYQCREVDSGGVVELGVFKGKSAILMGGHLRSGEVMTVCDLFEDLQTHQDTDIDTKRFFKAQSLSQSDFERNYLNFHNELPRVVKAPTSEITRHVAPGSARFVHVDAGHTYEGVREDIASSKTMLRENGVVALGDLFKPDMIGTPAAIWEAIFEGGLKPIANTQFKLYATWGDPKPVQDEIVKRAQGEHWLAPPRAVMIRDMPVILVQRKPD